MINWLTVPPFPPSTTTTSLLFSFSALLIRSLSPPSLLLIDHDTLPYREPASSVHSSPIPISPPSPPLFVMQ
ncbi:hypothetical protein PM082_022289 [Marasmius tenuissimus]|nr:hypothetical protein PM082_022289 [Marasmius tenuissimus]